MVTHHVQTVTVVANMDSVETLLLTACHKTTVRVSVEGVVHHQPVVLTQLLLLACLTKCSSTETTPDAVQTDFTLTMLSLMPRELITDLAPQEVVMTKEESSRLSLLKPPMKQRVDGQMHQMVDLHGDIVLLEKQAQQAGIVTPMRGRALKATLAEDPSNSLTTTTTGYLEGPLEGT